MRNSATRIHEDGYGRWREGRNWSTDWEEPDLRRGNGDGRKPYRATVLNRIRILDKELWHEWRSYFVAEAFINRYLAAFMISSNESFENEHAVMNLILLVHVPVMIVKAELFKFITKETVSLPEVLFSEYQGIGDDQSLLKMLLVQSLNHLDTRVAHYQPLPSLCSSVQQYSPVSVELPSSGSAGTRPEGHFQTGHLLSVVVRGLKLVEIRHQFMKGVLNCYDQCGCWVKACIDLILDSGGVTGLGHMMRSWLSFLIIYPDILHLCQYCLLTTLLPTKELAFPHLEPLAGYQFLHLGSRDERWTNQEPFSIVTSSP
ncbi:hypothetical protein Tco_0971526 [Tanacetum coccineum]